MKTNIVMEFLALHLKQGAKLLLGLSGGPDSMALLQFLIAARKKFAFSLHIAHVDHGWRKESKREAKILQKLAEQLKLPFHLHTLQGVVGGSNIENRCREDRLAFFTRLHQTYHFQALLLAHHSDDQIETILKRVFEGAGLRALGGLRSVKYFNDLLIWRPLLSLKKVELQVYLKKRNIFFFEDHTNHNSTYLRARMRKKILPDIEQNFGKNIQNNCLRLGALCRELSGYLEEKCQMIKNSLIQGPFGDCLPLIFHPAELRFFLKEYDTKAHLSATALDLVIQMVQQNEGKNRQIQAPPITFYINKNYLFMLKNPFPNFFKERKRWRAVSCGNWLNFWQGEIAIMKDVRMESFANIKPYSKKSVKKWYSIHAVPSFFYERAPIFIREEKIVGECLTGKCINALQLTA